MEFDLSRKTSRRAIIASLSSSAGLLGVQTAVSQSESLRPFRVAVPESKLRYILRRVRETRWPDRLDADDWRYGANWDYMRALAEYWTTKFDWRKAEANLNRYPRYLARVDEYDIHFYHIKGRGPKPLPIILTHGWPGSVFEFLDAIGPLTDPARFGASADDAFDVIVPSLPGFGFSSKPNGKPVGVPTTARLWNKLMTEVLHYPKYVAQGGDWGCFVTSLLGRAYPDVVLGIHLNATTASVPNDSEQTEQVREWLRRSAAYRTQESDYASEQRHKPQTVSFALSDNPIGWTAWMVEKFKVWSDSSDDLDQTFTKDQVLTNAMIYLITDTAGTGVWFYRGSTDEPSFGSGKIQVPIGYASFPKEMPYLNPPKSLLSQNGNLTHYTAMPRGGHFACLEQPKLFVDDLRLFCRSLRA